MGHLQHLKWPMAVRRPFILSLYGVSSVIFNFYLCAHNCSYFDFRPSETLILVIFRLFSPLGPKIQEMSHLQHLKWPMAVRRPFILSLYGVSGILIAYIFFFYKHNAYKHIQAHLVKINLWAKFYQNLNNNNL